MKNIKNLLLFSALLTVSLFSCKGKDKSSTIEDTTTTAVQPADTSAMQTASVQISADDSLTMMAKDAVKDYPGVTAAVSNGEVTLTGDIKRDKLPKLMMALSAMHPKKINNNLTINK